MDTVRIALGDHDVDRLGIAVMQFEACLVETDTTKAPQSEPVAFRLWFGLFFCRCAIA